MNTVNISLTSDQVKLVDTLTKTLDFANRSEFFRALVRLVERKPQVLNQSVTDFFEAPDTWSVSKIISSFKATKKYNQKFLSSMEKGLKESGYFTNWFVPKIIPPSDRVIKYITKRGLTGKYNKQIKLLSENLQHPGLNVERLEPKSRGFYSFRIDKQFRGFFFFISQENAIKIYDANDHYQ